MDKDDDKTDHDIFKEAMRGVRRINTSKINTDPPAPKTIPKRKRTQDEDFIDQSPFSDYETLEPVTAEDILMFHRPGIQHKILRKLRTGQYNIESILDLHGMKIDEASITLYRFLFQCHITGIRHVLIIHGKGRNNSKPILKNKLNHWLRQSEQVLAFCSAQMKDGRSGAMYVLLKQGRKV